MNTSSLKNLKYDFISAIVVFLVAVPLCLGVALASGAPIFSGILAGIIGGIVVGSISESAVSVSGPAAGMIAVVLAAISQLGGFENFLLALMLAGIIQIIVSALRAGFVADYIPANVIQGLLCAIGILIIVKQLPLAFTHTEGHKGLMALLKNSAQTLDIHTIMDFSSHINWGATIITFVSLTLLITHEKIKLSWLKKIPGPILVVLLGICINEIYYALYPNLLQDSAKLVSIPVNQHLSELFNQFIFPNWQSLTNPNIYFYAFIIAAVASLETLLNLEAAEKIDRKHKYCSRNRELLAQGIGNTLSGLLGGIPITSVVVRSSVNIQTGARSKASTIIHGLFFIAALLFFSRALNKIPLASLAAILIYVGYKLTHAGIYKKMYKQGFAYFFPFIVTVLVIVFTNILTGILVGLVCSIFFILKQNSQMRLDIIEEKHPSGIVHRIILPQQISFLKKASLVAELNSIAPKSRLIIDARYTKYIDNDILAFIREFAEVIANEKQIELNLIGFKKRYRIHNYINFINVTTFDIQSSLTPDAIISILKEGNQRFLKDQRINRFFPVEVKATANTQHPIAVVLSCIDSRVPVETVFDMGMGDLISIRIAGNVVNDDVLGSIEFGCHVANAKLILVLGHTRCGAIRAACGEQQPGYIAELLAKILPAVRARQQHSTNACTDEEGQIEITKQNINNSMDIIYQSSAIIKQLVDEKKVGLVSAMYDIRSGNVEFYDATDFHTVNPELQHLSSDLL